MHYTIASLDSENLWHFYHNLSKTANFGDYLSFKIFDIWEKRLDSGENLRSSLVVTNTEKNAYKSNTFNWHEIQYLIISPLGNSEFGN